MNRCIRLVLAGAIAATLAPQASAFRINPWTHNSAAEKTEDEAARREAERLAASTSPDKRIIAELVEHHLAAPVHEEMTLRSLSLYLHPGQSSDTWESLESDRMAPGLLYGVRWNDSPYVVRTFPAYFSCWFGGSMVSKNPVCWGRQMLYGKMNPAKKDFMSLTMIARSHFYDMQFLHAMGATGTAASHVAEQILMWGELVALIQADRIGEDTRFENVGAMMTPTSAAHWNAIFPGDSALADNRNMGKWRVGTMFRPDKQRMRYPLKDVALGSFLHIVQDSYAGGHVLRTVLDDVRLPWGKVEEFHSYMNQDTNWHGCHDNDPIRSAWKDVKDDPRSPIAIGSGIIGIFRSTEVAHVKGLETLKGKLSAAFLTLEDKDRKATVGAVDKPKCPL
jgi:hypothetical protein